MAAEPDYSSHHLTLLVESNSNTLKNGTGGYLAPF
jgi:hypothetical protein